MTQTISQTNKTLYFNQRTKQLTLFVLCIIVLTYIYIHGLMITEEMLEGDFLMKNLPPSLDHIFGTDALGRDMYLRTIKGLSLSTQIGFISTFFSVLISILFSMLLSVGNIYLDKFVVWLIDVFLSLPHMMFLILISVAVGKGVKGIVIGLAATHWTGLTRILRSEILQIKTQNYIKVSRSFGKSKLWVGWYHILPNLFPQIVVSAVLLFPHAILHESGISFLGFGLSLSTPAIGIILAESMKYLPAGHWWLGFFPGLLLVILVLAINGIGESLQQILDPHLSHL